MINECANAWSRTRMGQIQRVLPINWTNKYPCDRVPKKFMYDKGFPATHEEIVAFRRDAGLQYGALPNPFLYKEHTCRTRYAVTDADGIVAYAENRNMAELVAGALKYKEPGVEFKVVNHDTVKQGMALFAGKRFICFGFHSMQLSEYLYYEAME